MGGRQPSTGEKVGRTGIGVVSTGTRIAGVAAGKYVGPVAAANGGLKQQHTLEHEDTLAAATDLALVHYWAGTYDLAQAILLEALDVAPRVLRDEHPLVLRMQGNLGQVYEEQSRYDEAEVLYDQAHEACLRVHGPDDEETLTAQARRAAVYARQGRFDEAAPLATDVVERRRQLLGADNE